MSTSRRPDQMASAITLAVQQIIARGLQDPRIRGLITVTGVRVTADLQEAFIHVSVLPEEQQELTLHGLRSAANRIRRESGEIIDTRQLPKFVFRLDSATKKQAAVLKELDKVREERERQESTGPSQGTFQRPHPDQTHP